MGENHVMAIAISDPDFFTTERFKYWDQLCDKIDTIVGVNNIISVNRLSSLEKNSEEKKVWDKSMVSKRINITKKIRFFGHFVISTKIL